MKKFSAQEIVNINWIWDEVVHSNSGSIALATQIHSARQLERIANAMTGLNSRLDSLGADGLHRLIKVATQVMERRKPRRKRRKT